VITRVDSQVATEEAADVLIAESAGNAATVLIVVEITEAVVAVDVIAEQGDNTKFITERRDVTA
jgi:hypothetical protein